MFNVKYFYIAWNAKTTKNNMSEQPMALIWGGTIVCSTNQGEMLRKNKFCNFVNFVILFASLFVDASKITLFFCNIIIFILLLIIYNCTTHNMHSVCVRTKHHFPGWVIWSKVDVVFSMESFDCGDFNFSAEPHWQRGRFRSCTLSHHGVFCQLDRSITSGISPTLRFDGPHTYTRPSTISEKNPKEIWQCLQPH